MELVSIIGIGISKRSFQLHGATAEGRPVLRRTLSRGRLLEFLSEAPPCLVVKEACGRLVHRAGPEIELRQLLGIEQLCDSRLAFDRARRLVGHPGPQEFADEPFGSAAATALGG